MVVVIFRSRLREGADVAALTGLTKQMYELASAMPGFLGLKEYRADDGEAVALAEFASLDAVAAWREHPEHKAAQERGRKEFFSEYSVQVCTTVREANFSR
jgi:heme-degrading monooxygenase HmoA